MPETTPLIKAALNLRVGAGFDVYGEKMTDNEKRFIKSIFSGDSSDHDYYHTIRVYKLATKIAKQEWAIWKMIQERTIFIL